MKAKERANKVFDLAQLVIDGRPRRAIRLYCYRCGKPGTCLMNTMAFSNDDKEHRVAARKFNEMGWSVDLGRGKHFCPDCQASPQIKIEQKERDMAAVVSIPRQMSRDDRRVIFEKLNEVYLDEKQGYQPPWTDEKIAKDLGTPRAWVVQVREEMFGPVASNADIDDLLKQIGELQVGAKVARDFLDKLTTLERKADEIRKAVRP